MNNQLKAYRVKKGLSQEELSEITGISRPYISNLETGKQIPGISIAYRLAEALDTTTDDLFGDIFLNKVYSNKYVNKKEQNE